MKDNKKEVLEIEHYLQKAIVRLLHLKLKTGASLQELQSFADACVISAARCHQKEDVNVGFDIHSIAGVLRSWHTDTRFLTGDGNPRALPIRGKLGIQGLVTLHFPSEKFLAVVRTLKESGLIKRAGRSDWLPTERHARVPKATSEILRYMAEGVARLVETVTRNTHTGRKGDLLFERSCKVFHLPLADAAAFRDYSRIQGVNYIMAVDDWLESRVAASNAAKARACVAGAFGFAFIDDRPPRSIRANRGRVKRVTPSATHPSTPASKSSRRSSSANRP
jgi:hypothetical protein